MKVTLVGFVAAFLILLPTVVYYFTISILPGVLLAVVKYSFGEKAARPFYTFFNLYQNWLEDHWFTLVSLVLELVEGTKVSYTVVNGAGQAHLEQSGDCTTDGTGRRRPLLRHVLSPASGPGKVKIIMLNHHCRVDWIYLFFFCARSSLSSTLRIVLKEDLKKVPMVGCAMEHLRFLFLSRNWQADESYLREMVEYIKRSGQTTTILIFPEGTDLSPSNVTKSQEFARNNGLLVLHRVLNPRTTGLIALKNMFGAENVEEIVDCTMGYTYGRENTRPAELSLIDGNHPRRVHLLIRRYRLDSTTSPNRDDLKDIAPGKDDEALKQWLNDRFAEKEQLLSRFYNNNPVGFDEHDVRAVLGEQCGVLGYHGGQERAATPTPTNRWMEYVGEIGWAHVAVTIVTWFLYPIYIMTHVNFLLLSGYIAAVFYVQERIMKRFKGSQRVLLLHQVRDEETLHAKLTGSAKGRREAK